MTNQDKDYKYKEESPSYYQHHYPGMYSGRLLGVQEVNHSLTDILTNHMARTGSFHFYLFLRDGTQLSILSERRASTTYISVAQILAAKLTSEPLYLPGSMDILDLPDLIESFQKGEL